MECLRHESRGRNWVGLNVRGELEWWIWNVLKNEMGEENWLNRDALMVWYVKDIDI